jgi:hypothetical protein
MGADATPPYRGSLPEAPHPLAWKPREERHCSMWQTLSRRTSMQNVDTQPRVHPVLSLPPGARIRGKFMRASLCRLPTRDQMRSSSRLPASLVAGQPRDQADGHTTTRRPPARRRCVSAARRGAPSSTTQTRASPVVWPAPVVPLYVVLPWKSWGRTPHPPCRHVGTWWHRSPPVGTLCRCGVLGGVPRRARCLPPRT